MGEASIGRDFPVWGAVRWEVRVQRRASVVRRRRCGREVSQALAWEEANYLTCGRDSQLAGLGDGRPRTLCVVPSRLSSVSRVTDCALRHVPFLAFGHTHPSCPEQWESHSALLSTSSTNALLCRIRSHASDIIVNKSLNPNFRLGGVPLSWPALVCTHWQRSLGICIQVCNGDHACANKCAGK